MVRPGPPRAGGHELCVARVSDLGTVTSLLGQVGLPVAGVDDHLHDFVLLCQRGSAVACGGLEDYGRDLLLRSVTVAPPARGRGLGTDVVEALLAESRHRGADRVWLLTETAADWFRRFGFEPAAPGDVPDHVLASTELRDACPDTATAMVMRL